MMSIRVIALAAVSLALAAGQAAAGVSTVLNSAATTTYDLTSTSSITPPINGGIFQQGVLQPTGSGVINSFLRVQAIGLEQGYNTGGGTPFDDKSGISFNNADVSVSDLSSSIVTLNGTPYYRLMLDINQQGNSSNSLITLDRMQIYTSPIHNQVTNSFTLGGDLAFPSGASKVYDLDGPGATDNAIVLDWATNKGGSGKGDMFAYIPVSDFANAHPSDAFYLYCQFGVGDSGNAGFEEWAFVSAPVPEPLAIGSLALGGLLLIRRR